MIVKTNEAKKPLKTRDQFGFKCATKLLLSMKF